jgi:hypothetical protein
LSRSRLSEAHLVEQDGLQPAREIVERRLRHCKIFSLIYSSDRPDILLHGSDRIHVSVRVDKREAWSLDRRWFRKRDRIQATIKDFIGL